MSSVLMIYNEKNKQSEDCLFLFDVIFISLQLI